MKVVIRVPKIEPVEALESASCWEIALITIAKMPPARILAKCHMYSALALEYELQLSQKREILSTFDLRIKHLLNSKGQLSLQL